MDAISYTTAQQNLAGTMDRVCSNHEPVIITRDENQSVVMIALDDYQSLEETAFLLKSRANAQRLLGAIAEIQAGESQERELVD